jgi:membrane-associated phospholipid phosphatase
MSADASSKREAGKGAQAALRRCSDYVGAALALLVRPPRQDLRHDPHALWPLSLRQSGIAAGIALVIFILGMVFVDAAAIRGVTHLPRWIVWCFDQITDFGKSGWFLYPLGVLFLAIAALPMTLPRLPQLVLATLAVRVGFLFVAIGAPSLFDTIIKRMIGRARPLVTGSIDPYAFSPFIWRADYASLPSGHATTAFAVLVAFGTLWPRARTALWIYALAIAVSRVVVLAHHPTDVLAGAAVGVIGALLVRRWFALQHLGFTIGPQNSLQQWPGPSVKRIKAVARGLLAE